jgi:hypothetical protein
MRLFRWAILIAVPALVWPPSATTHAEEPKAYVLIVNKTNRLASLSPFKLRFVFLRKISRWPWGAEIVPVDLFEQSAIRRKFTRDILGQTMEALAVYWIEQRVTVNLEPPIQVDTALEAKRLVASRLGAIAYIPAADVDASVKVLDIQ